MKCPSCNWFYFETDKTCQHCNAPLPKPTKPKVSLEKVFSKSNTATVSKKSQAKVVGKSHIAVVVDNGNRPSEKSTDNVSNAPAKSVMTDIPNYNHLTDSCQSVHSGLTHELWLDSEDTHKYWGDRSFPWEQEVLGQHPDTDCDGAHPSSVHWDWVDSEAFVEYWKHIGFETRKMQHLDQPCHKIHAKGRRIHHADTRGDRYTQVWASKRRYKEKVTHEEWMRSAPDPGVLPNNLEGNSYWSNFLRFQTTEENDHFLTKKWKRTQVEKQAEKDAPPRLRDSPILALVVLVLLAAGLLYACEEAKGGGGGCGFDDCERDYSYENRFGPQDIHGR